MSSQDQAQRISDLQKAHQTAHERVLYAATQEAVSVTKYSHVHLLLVIQCIKNLQRICKDENMHQLRCMRSVISVLQHACVCMYLQYTAAIS
jgi:hypothetical protein